MIIELPTGLSLDEVHDVVEPDACGASKNVLDITSACSCDRWTSPVMSCCLLEPLYTNLTLSHLSPVLRATFVIELLRGGGLRHRHVRPAGAGQQRGVRYDAAGAVPGVRLLYLAMAKPHVHQAQGDETKSAGTLFRSLRSASAAAAAANAAAVLDVLFDDLPVAPVV